MSVSQLSDSVFEALLRQAVIDNIYEEIDSLPPDEVLAEMYTFSDAHKKRMKKLFASEARKETLRNAVKWGKRAAAVIVIVVAILSGSFMLVPQVRAVVAQTLIEWYEQFVRFTSSASETDKTSLEPRYIPEGFAEVVREETPTISTIIYMNDDSMTVAFQSAHVSGSISIDSEDKKYSMTAIDGVEYHFFDAEDSGAENSIAWETNGQRYVITSAISIDEMLKIAVSVG